MTARAKLIVDLLERTVFTWLETFLGLLIAANVFDNTTAGKWLGVLSAAQTAAVAAVPAALAVLKSGVSSLLGNRNTAAALPAQVDNAT